MADKQLLEIILIATIAAIVLFRLYAVLGRRTGHENPSERYGYSSPEVHDATNSAEPVHTIPARQPERPADPVSSGLFDISFADKNFDRDRFIVGARAAYEMIENAFAAGKREILKPLLGPEVFTAFETVIAEREALGLKCEFTFVGFREVKIVGALLRSPMAEITVSFRAEVINALTDAAGDLAEGSEKSVIEVNDIWTFARNVYGRNPNWILVATAAEA